MFQETRSQAEIVAALSPEERAELFADFTEEQLDQLMFDADFWLRPHQKITDGDWFITALICGRGWGKTRAITEWIKRKALEQPGVRIGIAGKNAADVRDTVIEGPSGLLVVHHPDVRPEYKPSVRSIQWPNGSRATTLSSESPDQGRGPGYHYVVMDEFAAWKEIRDDSGATLFSNLIAAAREGERPQLVIATTPKRTATMREIIAMHEEDPNRVRVIHGKTSDNKSLSDAYIKDFEKQYANNPDLYRQEILGLMIDDAEGLVFTEQMIEDNRIVANVLPSFRQYPLRVVAVDPTVAAEPRDECGIIVIGCTAERLPAARRAVVLDDLSLRARPDGDHGWAQRVVDTAKQYGTKFVVIEQNQGHDLLRSTIHAIDPSLVIFKVHAAKGKLMRAEPVAVALSQGRIKFWGTYPELEDQMNFYDPADTKSSPDRLDAFVWGITATIIDPPKGLMIGKSTITGPRNIGPSSRVGSGARTFERNGR
jgi:phage terminase large subunit-like protein